MKDAQSFNEVLSFLSPRLRVLLLSLSDDIKSSVWEIRLRVNCPVLLVTKNGNLFTYPNGRVSMIYSNAACTVSMTDITDTFNRICGYSVHSNASAIVNGFISLEGGHRAGVCGTAVCDADGVVTAVRDISCINLRIAGEFIGVADKLYELLFSDKPDSVIVAGPPVSGKTTLLRDLARQLSGPSRSAYYRTSIIDERGEIAASFRGQPQVDIGFCDVLTGYPKATAIINALRTLSPQIIICDEVGDQKEVVSICEGMNSGVDFIISAHLRCKEELFLRTPLRILAESGAFSKLVMLKGGLSPCVIDGIYDIKELTDEICGSCTDNNDLHDVGSISFKRIDNACQTA